MVRAITSAIASFRSRRNVHRLDTSREIEFLCSQVCAGAHSCGTELELTGLCLRRCDEFADGGNTSRLARDEHVGLAS